MVRWLARRLDVKTAVSDDARAMAQQALGGEYLVLFNGIEIDRIDRTVPIEADGPTIFFVGRHEPRKGLEVLLHAMALLPANVRLWVAGDGPDTARLKSTVAGDPRIEWLGRISDEEKFARLRGATVFCAPSLRGESFGVVLLEAMAAHTPIVASNLHGYANVARAGHDAVLVDPDDSAALAGALSSVIGDDRRRIEAGGVGNRAGRRLLDDGARRPLPRPLRRGHRQGDRNRPARGSGGTRNPTAAAILSYPGQGVAERLLEEYALIVVIVIVVILVLLLLYVFSQYNGLVRLRNRVEAAWAQIDVQLKRRWDLIPNLVETVKGYASHERETLEAVIAARNAATTATGPAQAAQSDNLLTGALRQLFAVAEAYPDLKANTNFLQLQEELTGTEGRIAYARQYYNDRC